MHVFVLTARAEAFLDADGYDVELDGDAVISNSAGYDLPLTHTTRIFPEHHHNKKYQTGKHISFKVIVPETTLPTKDIVAYKNDKLPIAMPKKYAYLFFQEINPPPPKAA